MTTDTATALREWARGMFTTEAATDLLIGSFRGRFAAVGNPWVQPGDDDGAWIDFDSTPSQVGGLSGGERAILLIAASIGGSTQVNLGDGVCSLDRRHLGLVLAAGSCQRQSSPRHRRIRDAGRWERPHDLAHRLSVARITSRSTRQVPALTHDQPAVVGAS